MSEKQWPPAPKITTRVVEAWPLLLEIGSDRIFLTNARVVRSRRYMRIIVMIIFVLGFLVCFGMPVIMAFTLHRPVSIMFQTLALRLMLPVVFLCMLPALLARLMPKDPVIIRRNPNTIQLGMFGGQRSLRSPTQVTVVRAPSVPRPVHALVIRTPAEMGAKATTFVIGGVSSAEGAEQVKTEIEAFLNTGTANG